MYFGILRSRIIQHPELPEAGWFEQPVTAEDELWKRATDKQDFFFFAVAVELAMQVNKTQTESKDWSFYPAPFVCRNMGWAEDYVMHFSGKDQL